MKQYATHPDMRPDWTIDQRWEDYTDEDVIGKTYTGNPRGFGRTDGHVEDNLDSIRSVSVRRASDLKLVACAQVHLPHGHGGSSR